MTLESLEGGRTKLVTISLFLTEEDRAGMMSSGMEQGLKASYRALDRCWPQLDSHRRLMAST